MNKIIKRTLIALFSVVFLVCTALFLAACGEEESGTPHYKVTLDYEQAQGTVTLSDPADSKGYVKDEDVTVTFTANSGYAVSEVKVNDTAVTYSGNTYTFKIQGDTTVAVTFAVDPFNGKTAYDFKNHRGIVFTNGSAADLHGTALGSYEFNGTNTLTIDESDYTYGTNHTLVIDQEIYYLTGVSYTVAVGSPQKNFVFTMTSVEHQAGDEPMSTESITVEFENVTFDGSAVTDCEYEYLPEGVPLGSDINDTEFVKFSYGTTDGKYVMQAEVDVGNKTYTETFDSVTVYTENKDYKAVISMRTNNVGRDMYLYKKVDADYVLLKDDSGSEYVGGNNDTHTWTLSNTVNNTVTKYSVTTQNVTFDNANHQNDSYPENAIIVVQIVDTFTSQTIVVEDMYQIVINYKTEADIEVIAFRIKATPMSSDFSTFYNKAYSDADCVSGGDKVFVISKTSSGQIQQYTVTLTGELGNYGATVEAEIYYTASGNTQKCEPANPYGFDTVPSYRITLKYNYTSKVEGGYDYEVLGIIGVGLDTDTVTDYTVNSCEKQPDGTFKVNLQQGDFGDPFDLVFHVELSGTSPGYPNINAYVSDKVTSSDGYEVELAIAGGSASTVLAISKDDVDYVIEEVVWNSEDHLTVTASAANILYTFTIAYKGAYEQDPSTVTVTQTGEEHQTEEITVNCTVDGNEVPVVLTVDLVDQTIVEVSTWDGGDPFSAVLTQNKKSVYLLVDETTLYTLTLGYDNAKNEFTATVNDDLSIVMAGTYYMYLLLDESQKITADSVKAIVDPYENSALDFTSVSVTGDGTGFNATIAGKQYQFSNLNYVSAYGVYFISYITEEEEFEAYTEKDGYYVKVEGTYNQIEGTLISIENIYFVYSFSGDPDMDKIDFSIVPTNTEAGADNQTKKVTTAYGVYNIKVVFDSGVDATEESPYTLTVNKDSDSEEYLIPYYVAENEGSNTGYVAFILHNSDDTIKEIEKFIYTDYSEGYLDLNSCEIIIDVEDGITLEGVSITGNSATLEALGKKYTLTVEGGKLTVTVGKSLVGAMFYSVKEGALYSFVSATEFGKQSNNSGSELKQVVGTWSSAGDNQIQITYKEDEHSLETSVTFTYDENMLTLTSGDDVLYRVGETHTINTTGDTSKKVEFNFLLDAKTEEDPSGEGSDYTYLYFADFEIIIDDKAVENVIDGVASFHCNEQNQIILQYYTLEDDIILNVCMINLNTKTMTSFVGGVLIQALEANILVVKQDATTYAINVFDSSSSPFDISSVPMACVLMSEDQITQEGEFTFYIEREFMPGMSLIYNATINNLDVSSYDDIAALFANAGFEFGNMVDLGEPIDVTDATGNYKATIYVDSENHSVCILKALKKKGDGDAFDQTIEVSTLTHVVIGYNNNVVTVIGGENKYTLTFSYDGETEGGQWSLTVNVEELGH